MKFTSRWYAWGVSVGGSVAGVMLYAVGVSVVSFTPNDISFPNAQNVGCCCKGKNKDIDERFQGGVILSMHSYMNSGTPKHGDLLYQMNASVAKAPFSRIGPCPGRGQARPFLQHSLFHTPDSNYFYFFSNQPHVGFNSFFLSLRQFEKFAG